MYGKTRCVGVEELVEVRRWEEELMRVDVRVVE